MRTKQVVITVTIDVDNHPDQDTIDYLEEDVLNFIGDHKELNKYISNDCSGEMTITTKRVSANW